MAAYFLRLQCGILNQRLASSGDLGYKVGHANGLTWGSRSGGSGAENPSRTLVKVTQIILEKELKNENFH